MPNEIAFRSLEELIWGLRSGIVISLLISPIVYLAIRARPWQPAANAPPPAQDQTEEHDQSASAVRTKATAIRAAADSHAGMAAVPSGGPRDLSGWVCAIIAAVLFTLGVIVSAVLIGFASENSQTAAAATFLVCMVLAILFGLVGRRYSLGRYIAAAALMVLLGALAVQFFRGDRLEQHRPWESESNRLHGGDQRFVIPPIAEPQSDLLGKPFVVAGRTTTGKTLTTADWKGKVVLVEFWATWAPPCTEELPRLKELYKAYHAKGLEIVSVDCDDSDNTVNSFIKKKEMPWPQLREESQTAGEDWHPLAKQWGVKGIPTMFLVDTKGVLRFVDARKDAAEKIATLLAE
jgi:thiol-disulfide isomerase/thioredoxin